MPLLARSRNGHPYTAPGEKEITLPRYEFICTDCNARTELRASIREKQAGLSPRCSSCGGEALRRSFQAVALVPSRGAGPSMPAPAAGGCCGGGCGCG